MLRRIQLARKMVVSSFSTLSTKSTLAPVTDSSAIPTLAVDPVISALAPANDPMVATAATADPPVPPTNSPKLRQKVMKAPAADPTATAPVLKTLLAGKAPACDPMVATAAPATADPPIPPTPSAKLRQKVMTAPATDPTATAPVMKTLLGGKAPAYNPAALSTPSSVVMNIYAPVKLVINQMFSVSDAVPSYLGPYSYQVRSFSRPNKPKNRKSTAKLARLRSIKCANCTEKVCSKKAMDLHNKNDHPDMLADPTTHVCNRCGNLYATEAKLKAHVCDVPPGNRDAKTAALVAKMNARKAGRKSVPAVAVDVEEDVHEDVEEDVHEDVEDVQEDVEDVQEDVEDDLENTE